jgi:hypothetical protein
MTNIRQDKLMNLAAEGLKEYSESQEGECVYLLILGVWNQDRFLIVHLCRRSEDRR